MPISVSFLSSIGLVREKTGSVLVAGIAHGLPDAVGEAFTKILSLPF